MANYLVKNGISSNGVVLGMNDSMYVSSGGSANNTTVDSGGYMYVANGGTVYETRLNCDVSATVYGSASSMQVGSRSMLMIYSSGKVAGLTVDSGGRAYLKGTVELGDAVVSRGGILLAVSSAKLTGDLTIKGELRTTDYSNTGTLNAQDHTIKLDLNGRHLEEISFIDNLANLSNYNLSVTVSNTQSSGIYHLAGGAGDFSGTITVCSENGTCKSLTVGGNVVIGTQTFSLNVTDNVLALNVTNTGTQEAVAPGEYVPGTWSTDWVQASEYAKAHNMKIFAYYGDKTWCGYCSMMNTQLFGAEDFQELSKSVVLLYDTPVPGKTYSGAPAAFLLDANGERIAYRYGFGSGTHDSWMTWLKIQLNQIAGTFHCSGTVYNSLGLNYTDLTINSGYSGYVISANLNNAQLNTSGFLYVKDHGNVSSGIVSSMGRVYVSEGGLVTHLAVNGGYVYVSSGGTAVNTTLSSGYVYVSEGGSAVGMVVSSGACLRGSSGAYLSDASVNVSGRVYVYSGADAHNTTVNGGYFYIYGGTAVNTTVTSSGYVSVSSTGTLSNTVVNSGGSVYINSGCTQTGSLSLVANCRFYVYDGGMVDFDISGRTSSDDVLINDFSMISGSPGFTLTVSSDQASGQYKLASGVNSFSKTITVYSETEENLGTVSIGNNLAVGENVYSLTLDDGILTLQIGATGPVEDTLLPYTLPQAEYMYGCVATATGMLLGYYDLYGYSFNGQNYDFSNLIEGTISVDSRGSDGGSVYDMSDPSVLANFIASDGYVSRFYDQTPEHELPYTYVNSDPNQGLNVSVWDCLADYLGTGQYWRGNEDLSTSYYYADLDYLLTAKGKYTVKSGFLIPYKFHDFKYGLYIYAQERGYQLDTEATQSVEIDEFSFDQFMAEIDAGRPVLLSMQAGSYGHMVIAYGYNSESQEVIFDDTYRTGCRMKWDGTYTYGGSNYSLSGVSTVVFDVSGQEALPADDQPVKVFDKNDQLVSSGDYMQGKTVNGNNVKLIQVSSGGMVYNTTVNSGGILELSGGPVSGSSVFSGGHASVTQVNSAGAMYVGPGAVASGTIIAAGGSIFVNSAVPSSGSNPYVSGFADVSDLTVRSGGLAVIDAGSLLRGEQIYGGTIMLSGSVAAGSANVAFAVAQRKTADNVIVNNLTYLNASSYSVSVAANQAQGTYKLAAGASAFTGSMDICSGEECFGTITVNGEALINDDISYRLSVIGDTLLLTVSSESSALPCVLSVTADVTEPTNQDVTVTAVFSSNSVSKEYSFDNQNWLSYTEPLVLTQNATAYFRAGNGTGYSEISSITVSNIDKVAPEAPIAVADITALTSGNVTVTAVFSEDSVLKQYSVNNNIWQDYTSGVVFSENGTVRFRSIDAAGNISDVSEYTVSNITGEIPESVAGDLNADGRADIVMTITEVGHGAEGATGAWLIQEDQTAAWGDLSTRDSDWEIFGTGKTAAGKNTDDVYIKSTGNIIGAWTTGDDGKVNGWETIGEFDSNTQIVGLGDFNANGQTDLLLRNVNGAVGCFFTGDEKHGWNYFQSLGDEWKLTAVGDLNGDGRDDVVLKHDAGFAGSWLTQADGTMAWADLDTLPGGFSIVGAGDFNGDGTDDVLLKSGNYYGAWLVNNGNAAGWMGLGDLGNVTVEQIADFNGDGKDDLRIRTSAGDLGTQLVMGEDILIWKYYGSVGSEWSTGLAALA